MLDRKEKKDHRAWAGSEMEKDQQMGIDLPANLLVGQEPKSTEVGNEGRRIFQGWFMESPEWCAHFWGSTGRYVSSGMCNKTGF